MKRTPYQMDQRVFKWMRPLFLAGSFARRSFLPELRGWGPGVLCECPLATMHELLGDTRIVSLCKGASIVIGHVPGTGRSGDTRVEAGIVTGRRRFRNGTVGHVQQRTVLLGVPFVGFVADVGHFDWSWIVLQEESVAAERKKGTSRYYSFIVTSPSSI